MNNKGFTIVELIISFVLVMTISVGLFKVVDSYRQKQQQESYKKMTKAYANEILTNIQTDVIDGGGVVEVTPVNVTAASSVCKGYNQGIKIKLRNSSEEKVLCVGNGSFNSNKNGVLYDGIYYEKPSKFIEILDDFLFSYSNEFVYNTCRLKKVWNININFKHQEVKDTLKINITSPQTTTLLGDFDKDGSLTSTEINRISNYATESFTEEELNIADFDRNGSIDSEDSRLATLCKNT